MYRMIVQVTREFETVAEAEAEYDEISGELRKRPQLHINCRIVSKLTGYSPENPEGREKPA